MHRELDHAFDDQHDIEPVHFHEHAVLKAVHHEDAQGQELSLSQGGQGSHEKAKVDSKTSHTG